jgi:hypothetical protein
LEDTQEVTVSSGEKDIGYKSGSRGIFQKEKEGDEEVLIVPEENTKFYSDNENSKGEKAAKKMHSSVKKYNKQKERKINKYADSDEEVNHEEDGSDRKR